MSAPTSWQRPRFRPPAAGRPQGSAVGGGKSPYRLGRDFERATRGRLERRGFYVMRSSLSKGKIDLLAVKALRDYPTSGCEMRGVGGRAGHLVLGVQCKRRGDIGSTEWNELFDLCEPHGIMPVVATKTGDRTTSFYRLDARRVPRAQGRPWTEIDVASGEPVPAQTMLVG